MATELCPIKRLKIKSFLVELVACQFWSPNCHWFENDVEERIGTRKLVQVVLIKHVLNMFNLRQRAV